MHKRPFCYQGCTDYLNRRKRVRFGGMFCSKECAANFGVKSATQEGYEWCPTCEDWTDCACNEMTVTDPKRCGSCGEIYP